jgi:hypothetical protein
MASAKKSARSAPAKSKAAKKSPAAQKPKAAPAKAKAPAKAAKAKTAKGRKPAAKKAGKSLAAQVAKALGVSETQAVAMAIGELGARLNVGGGEAGKAKAAASAKEKAPETSSSMGQRLFLALDNRGLDGMGMPVEVIDLPCILGSGKSCTIWVNSPQIETRHAQITRGDEGWTLEDLGSTHGTFFEGNPLGRRVLQHGDLFLLANYLRVRAELR